MAWFTENGQEVTDPDEVIVVTIPRDVSDKGGEVGIQVGIDGEVSNAYGDGIVGISDEERELATEETEGVTFYSGEYVVWESREDDC